MSTFTINSPPTIDELRFLIEIDDTYDLHIKRGGVAESCTKFCQNYSELFAALGVDHVQLYTSGHAYMAIKAAEPQTLIFDPTFNQYYPDYGPKYFLGSVAELLAYASESGGIAGMNATIPTPRVDDVYLTTAGQAFLAPRIIVTPSPAGRRSYIEIKDSLDHWSRSLGLLRPKACWYKDACDQIVRRDLTERYEKVSSDFVIGLKQSVFSPA